MSALAACYDGATGHRAELRAARAWLEQAADGESVDLTREVVRYGAHLYPLRCGAEPLINRFRTECYQLDEPDLTRAIDWRPDQVCDDLQGAVLGWERCEEGPRPRAAVQEILRGWWPNRCEDFPDETPETLGWLGCACWQERP
jgi:hypothetical protein